MSGGTGGRGDDRLWGPRLGTTALTMIFSPQNTLVKRLEMF